MSLASSLRLLFLRLSTADSAVRRHAAFITCIPPFNCSAIPSSNFKQALRHDLYWGPLDSSISLDRYHSLLLCSSIWTREYIREDWGGTIFVCGGTPYIHPSSSSKMETLCFPYCIHTIQERYSGRTPQQAETIEEYERRDFAPVLKVAVFDELEELSPNNAVPQGLSSVSGLMIVRHLGKWIGPEGSDTGIVNFNVGTRARDRGCVGGNKSTVMVVSPGGDCVETITSGSRARSYSREAPLSQGVTFRRRLINSSNSPNVWRVVFGDDLPDFL
ncbi:hypothetical protein BS47DRAFT_1484230 [Hydnum rufescens UP504]|uniref:Uncharacterized protein n=1 Tax=Hydnum rufescens UP504 TaxID=1448309 RepID=A0A9P6B1S5_9AGAM|nr:hypothetical protein BS47DRAFT_1484230 [Hydnum rufescens UP504]